MNGTAREKLQSFRGIATYHHWASNGLEWHSVRAFNSNVGLLRLVAGVRTGLYGSLEERDLDTLG